MSTVEKKEVSDPPSVEIGIVASSKTNEEYVGLTGSSPREEIKSGATVTDTIGGTWADKYHEWRHQKYKLPRHYRLVSSKRSLVSYATLCEYTFLYFIIQNPSKLKRMHASTVYGVSTLSSWHQQLTQRCSTLTLPLCVAQTPTTPIVLNRLNPLVLIRPHTSCPCVH